MSFESDAFIAGLPPQLRRDVDGYLSRTKKSLDDIWSADTGCIWEMGYVHGLINHLGAKDYPLAMISLVVKQPKDRVKRVLDARREYGQPIRTMNWERA